MEPAGRATPGLVSVGQQAFIGLGAYVVLFLGLHGVGPFAAIPLARVGCAVLALPISLLLFRLRGGYFAIATWVVADTFRLLVSRFADARRRHRRRRARASRASTRPCCGAYTYWASLAVAVAGARGGLPACCAGGSASS